MDTDDNDGSVGKETYVFTPVALKLESTDKVKDMGIAPHTCVTLLNGKVKCSGTNRNGESGGAIMGNDILVTSFTLIDGLNNVVQTSEGGFHNCSLLKNGTVKCWGWNSSGQLGDGTTADSFSPVKVKGVSKAISINVNIYHSCVISSETMPMCWGANANGQLGGGSIGGNSSIPVKMKNLF